MRLQWRAGHSPGQTFGLMLFLHGTVPASMEGRTLARPDASRGRWSPRCSCSFNGGPDTRPARRRRPAEAPARGYPASMEGRTLARPDRSVLITPTMTVVASMEGRTLARPDFFALHESTGESSLQWRAGHSPGQTGHAASGRYPAFWCFNGGPDTRPARLARTAPSQKRASSFNGGPDTRPARLGDR